MVFDYFRVIVANMSMTEQIESALNSVASRFLAPGAQISDLKRLSGGASQETWAFAASLEPNTSERFILRRSPNGLSDNTHGHKISLKTEAALIRAAHTNNVPVPEVVYVCQDADGLGDGFIMRFIEGETIARKILRDDTFKAARGNLAVACGDALANIHGLSKYALPDLPVSDGPAQLHQYEEIYRTLDIARPVFELAFQTLKRTLPDTQMRTLVHGDFRLGNLMIGETGLRAVLDWELAHIGDPREDLAWICVNSWRFGQSDKRVGGFGRVDEMLTAYEAAGGISIAPADLDWWEMLGTLKWGIMCMIMYDAYRKGADISVERAAIGRRVSETEIDLLNLIEARSHV